MTQLSLSGKTALVTGGSEGIGLGTATLFAEAGAFVYITGRRQAELDKAVATIGVQARAIRADSTDLADLDRVYHQIRAESGHLDVLFANAGGGSMLPLGDITEQQVDETLNRNIKGVIFTVQKALPLMKHGASIVLGGSVTSIQGTPAFSVYSASKAAVRNLARSWLLDLKDRGIRVNTISPGPILTPGLTGLAGADKLAQQSLVEHLTSQIPAGRIGHPRDVAQAVLFLASDAASFINGIELFVDGGLAQV